MEEGIRRFDRGGLSLIQRLREPRASDFPSSVMSVSRRMFVKAGAVIAAGICLRCRVDLFCRTNPATDGPLAPVKNANGFWTFLPNIAPAGGLWRDRMSQTLVFGATATGRITPTRLRSGYVGFF